MNKDIRYNRSAKGLARYRSYRERHPGLKTRNDRRVFGASGYLGMAPSPEQAKDLTQLGREFRGRQNQTRA